MRLTKALLIFLLTFLCVAFLGALLRYAKAPEWAVLGFSSGVFGVMLTFLAVQVRQPPKP